MTKLLDADWLRGVQLFHQSQGSTVNDFPKTNKMVERYLHTNLVDPETSLHYVIYKYVTKKITIFEEYYLFVL